MMAGVVRDEVVWSIWACIGRGSALRVCFGNIYGGVAMCVDVCRVRIADFEQ